MSVFTFVIIQGICLVVSAMGCSYAIFPHTLDKTRKKGHQNVV